MKTYKLHLIRHGITEGNLNGQYIGRTELPLAPGGVAALKNLTEKIEYPAVEKIYSSPMLRCRQTAKIVYPEREILVVPDLIEYDFGEFEGKTAEELENIDFSGIDLIGVTAGASTPDGIITEVIKVMENKEMDFEALLEEAYASMYTEVKVVYPEYR